MKTLSWPSQRSSGTGAAQKSFARHRVLIADDDSPFARKLSEYLREHGFDARISHTITETKELIEFWKPDTVFVDLLLPETNALSLFRFLNTKPLPAIPKIVVMSKQALPQGVEQIRRAGASHYLVKPFPLEEAFHALALISERPIMAAKKTPENVLQMGPGTIKELHLLNLFLKQATASGAGETALYNLMRMINLKVKAIRCSLIQVRGSDVGRVLASNDDESVRGLDLDLHKYPELLEVRRTLGPVIIPNARVSDILVKVRTQIGRTPFETIIAFPVLRYGEFFGVLSIRMKQRDPLELFYIEKFGLVCAQILSLAIGVPGQQLIVD